MPQSLDWLAHAQDMDGPGFAEFHRGLTAYNATALSPSFPDDDDNLATDAAVTQATVLHLDAIRRAVAPLTRHIPLDADGFIAWFERLRDVGPGQGDSLFPWLASQASAAQMKWFLLQEVAGEAGFDDLVAVTQVKMPARAKLEMARNYWDEMGRGDAKGMHGPMLERLADYFDLKPTPVSVVPEALALGNMMIAMGFNRRYAFHSVGALGVIEMTAPTRAGHVDRGLRRLGVPGKKRHYFALHSILDVKHSEAWNAEVMRPLVKEDPRRAQAIGEGAMIRLWLGARCFERYRHEFGLVAGQLAA
jgi:hypothetical protein